MKNERLKLAGEVDIVLIRNGIETPVYRGKNSISPSAYFNFMERIYSKQALEDFSISTFFTSDDQAGGTSAGKDGIVCGSVGDVLTCITTSVSADNTYGRKWRGEIQFSGPRTVSFAAIGHDFIAGDQTTAFNEQLASNSFAGVDVVQSDRMVFNWEIYIQ